MEYIVGGITLQYIFFTYWRAYCGWFKGTIRPAVRENVEKILKCGTPQLGFHYYSCPKCGAVRLIPHTCKSRFCSSCGKIATDKWTEERLSDVLDVGYHHLVFTIPWQLRAICSANRGVMFQLLFEAAALSLMSWCNEFGSYLPGIYIVLHTFGSDLKLNPHLHILITAGGLSLDYKKWINAPEAYLMPEKGLKKRWKYNVISGIIELNNKRLLKMPFLPAKGEYIKLRVVVSLISKLLWYVYIGARLAQVGLTVKYIGRYTKKPVIAETRIISCNERWVVFSYKDYANDGKTEIKKMGLFTFITYLTQHIHDKHFRVVRGYGLFSNRLKGQLLPKARILLGKSQLKSKKTFTPWRERKIKQTGIDPLLCEKCHIEMYLVFICFVPDIYWIIKLGIDPFAKIPNRQINLRVNSS